MPVCQNPEGYFYKVESFTEQLNEVGYCRVTCIYLNNLISFYPCQLVNSQSNHSYKKQQGCNRLVFRALVWPSLWF